MILTDVPPQGSPWLLMDITPPRHRWINSTEVKCLARLAHDLNSRNFSNQLAINELLLATYYQQLPVAPTWNALWYSNSRLLMNNIHPHGTQQICTAQL